MNKKQILIPAGIFMAGYVFQMIDHSHRATLSHGYTLAILMLAVFGTLWAVRQLDSKQQSNHIDLDFRPRRDVHLLESDPIEPSHVLKTEQRAHKSA